MQCYRLQLLQSQKKPKNLVYLCVQLHTHVIVLYIANYIQTSLLFVKMDEINEISNIELCSVVLKRIFGQTVVGLWPNYQIHDIPSKCSSDCSDVSCCVSILLLQQSSFDIANGSSCCFWCLYRLSGHWLIYCDIWRVVF